MTLPSRPVTALIIDSSTRRSPSATLTLANQHVSRSGQSLGDRVGILAETTDPEALLVVLSRGLDVVLELEGDNRAQARHASHLRARLGVLEETLRLLRPAERDRLAMTAGVVEAQIDRQSRGSALVAFRDPRANARCRKSMHDSASPENIARGRRVRDLRHRAARPCPRRRTRRGPPASRNAANASRPSASSSISRATRSTIAI